MFICDACLDKDYPTAKQNMLAPDISFRSHGQCEKCDEVADCRDVPSWFLAKNMGPKLRAFAAKRRARALRFKVHGLAFDHEEDLNCLPDELAQKVYDLAGEYENLLGEVEETAEALQGEVSRGKD